MNATARVIPVGDRWVVHPGLVYDRKPKVNAN